MNRKIVLALISLLVLSVLIGCEESELQEKAPLKISEKEYLNLDFDDLVLEFVDPTITDLQRESKIDEYKGKYIKGQGIVMEIVDAWGSPAVGIMNPMNEFLMGATIYFKKSEKEKLLDVGKYDSINFEGRIDSYNSIMGIIIRDAEVITTN